MHLWRTSKEPGTAFSIPCALIPLILPVAPEVVTIIIIPIIQMRKLRLGGKNIYIYILFLPKFTELINGRSREKIRSGSKLLSSIFAAASLSEFCEMSVVIPDVLVVLIWNILEVKLLKGREETIHPNAIVSSQSYG